MPIWPNCHECWFAAITCHVNPNGESSIGKQISGEISLSLSSIHLCSDFFASHAWRTFQETFLATCYKCATQFSQSFCSLSNIAWTDWANETKSRKLSARDASARTGFGLRGTVLPVQPHVQALRCWGQAQRVAIACPYKMWNIHGGICRFSTIYFVPI